MILNFAMSLLDRITIEANICHGKPVVRGLRYTVESLLEHISAGDSFEDLLKEFPDLQREDILACLEFAAKSLHSRGTHLAMV